MPEWLAIGLALVLVVVAQIKINVTNAYSGSLAWSNVYTRLTKTYPGRAVFIFFNLAIALALMWMDVFSLISFVLSLYANVVMAWLVTIAADIVINKHVLHLSPMYPEFRRGMLHDWNPVGLVSVGLASLLSLAAFSGLFGQDVRPFSVLIAIGVAMVTTPLMAVVTRGRYYLRRQTDGIASPIVDTDGNPSGERLRCHVTGYTFERPDMLASAERGTARGDAVCVLTCAHAGRFGSIRIACRAVVAASSLVGTTTRRDQEAEGKGRVMAEVVDTPTAILANAAAALRENPFDDISYRSLGDAVGVSERTVYRHFPTRSHLLEGVAGWIESTEFPLPPFVTIAQFQEAARATVPGLRCLTRVRLRVCARGIHLADRRAGGHLLHPSAGDDARDEPSRR